MRIDDLLKEGSPSFSFLPTSSSQVLFSVQTRPRGQHSDSPNNQHSSHESVSTLTIISVMNSRGKEIKSIMTNNVAHIFRKKGDFGQKEIGLWDTFQVSGQKI